MNKQELVETEDSEISKSSEEQRAADYTGAFEFKPYDFTSRYAKSLGKYAAVESLASEDDYVRALRENIEEQRKLAPDGMTIRDLENKERQAIEYAVDPENARLELSRLTSSQRHRFNQALGSWQEKSTWLDGVLGVEKDQTDDKEKDYVGALLDRDDQGNYRFNTNTFRNFLEWHNYNLAVFQKELDAKAAEDVDEFKSHVYESVDRLEIPQSAAENAEALGSSVRFVADDGLISAKINSSGWTEYDNTVYISPDSYNRNTTYHELGHNISGESQGVRGLYRMSFYETYGMREELDDIDAKLYGTRQIYEDDSEEARKLQEEENRLKTRRLHLESELSIYHKGCAVLDEAVNETSRYKIDKAASERSSISAQNVLKAIIYNGNHPIDEKLFLEAYFDNSDTPQPLSVQKLKDELEMAFPGIDILHDLGEIEARKNNVSVFEVAGHHSDGTTAKDYYHNQYSDPVANPNVYLSDLNSYASYLRHISKKQQ